MIPVLLEIGPVKLYSFGLMLGLAFIIGSAVLSAEMKRRGLGAQHASTVTLIAVVAGIAGAKILSIFEEWDLFLKNPSIIFSPGGLTWYGGFLLGIVAVIAYIRRHRVSVLPFLDALSIALILAYGIGRIGCHLSGDGDYGTPTTLPWGTIYAEGTAKPSRMLEDYFSREPEEAETWRFAELRAIPAGVDGQGIPINQFDLMTPLHPTPIYELLMGILGYVVLRLVARGQHAPGFLFSLYLMLSSVFRFSVEFIRLQPRLAFGLSEAQLFALAIFAAGAVGVVIAGRHGMPRDQNAPQPH